MNKGNQTVDDPRRRYADERDQAVIQYYDAQTDEEHAREIETAEEVESWIRVPTALLPEVKALIRAHQSRRAS